MRTACSPPVILNRLFHLLLWIKVTRISCKSSSNPLVVSNTAECKYYMNMLGDIENLAFWTLLEEPASLSTYNKNNKVTYLHWQIQYVFLHFILLVVKAEESLICDFPMTDTMHACTPSREAAVQWAPHAASVSHTDESQPFKQSTSHHPNQEWLYILTLLYRIAFQARLHWLKELETSEYRRETASYFHLRGVPHLWTTISKLQDI